MSDTYHPSLEDVAKLVSATGGAGPNPEASSLLHWLIEQIPEVRDYWKKVNRVLLQGITLLDLVRLMHCLHDEVTSDEAYGTAVRLLRQMPTTDGLWQQLEQMGRDAGQLLQYPVFGIGVLHRHWQVDRLVAGYGQWTTAEEYLDVTGLQGDFYVSWISIVEARLARGDGDPERLRAVRNKLRAEVALHRHRPLLEDLLGQLAAAYPANLGQLLDAIRAIGSSETTTTG